MASKRKVTFAPNQYYHIYNRTNGEEQIFNQKTTITRALELMGFYRFKQDLRYSFFQKLNNNKKNEYLFNNTNIKPSIEIFAYSFMPNHFHFLLMENQTDGIKNFISNIQNSLAKYINLKFKRNGALFQSPFKATHIEAENELLHLSRYIHLNPVTSYLMEFDQLKVSNLTSFPLYIDNSNTFINAELITSIAGSKSKYISFMENQIDYQRNLNKIKYLLMEK